MTDQSRVPILSAVADVMEPNSSDSRGDRLDFFVKQEEALSGDPAFLSQSLAAEKDDPACQAASVANLRAALMSKNSLLSLRAEMLGEDSPLLFDYLPKGGHSLSRKSAFLFKYSQPGRTLPKNPARPGVRLSVSSYSVLGIVLMNAM